MRTLLPDPPPAEFQELLERRRRWGADTHDEVWEGVLHMNPARHRRDANLQAQLLEVLGPLARKQGLTAVGEFNLGEPDDYRVPDAGIHRPGPDQLYNPTAALVVEIVSPGDETRAKLPFYAAQGVEEMLIIHPEARSIEWLALSEGQYQQVEQSGLLEVTVSTLASQIVWPE